jgi:hypothetical protein
MVQAPREAGAPEQTKLANLFAAIGNATNEAIQDMPAFSDEGVRQQMMRTFAAVGGFVMYADMLDAFDAEGFVAGVV